MLAVLPKYPPRPRDTDWLDDGFLHYQLLTNSMVRSAVGTPATEEEQPHTWQGSVVVFLLLDRVVDLDSLQLKVRTRARKPGRQDKSNKYVNVPFRMRHDLGWLFRRTSLRTFFGSNRVLFQMTSLSLACLFRFDMCIPIAHHSSRFKFFLKWRTSRGATS